METPAYRKKKVQEMLDYLSEIGLHVQLGCLLEAKKAGEITMEGWLNQSRGKSNEQEGTE